MELIVMLMLMAGVAALIVWPLLGRHPEAGRPEPRSGEGELPASRSHAALSAIKELEFDFQTGKISEDDYKMLRGRHEVKAVDALTVRSAEPSPAAGSTDDPLEAEIRAARGRRFCTSCGARLPAAARFCPSCGTAAGVPA